MDITQELSPSEVVELASCEETIARGLSTFIEVGRALARIRDAQLYRSYFSTFEEYCDKRWDLSSQHAGRLMAATEVVSTLSGSSEPIGSVDQFPMTESQARELAPLLDEPEKLKAAWEDVLARTDKPTAAVIREVVQERIKNSMTPTPPREPTPLTATMNTEEDGSTTLTIDPKEATPTDLARLLAPQRIIGKILTMKSQLRAVVHEVQTIPLGLDDKEREGVSQTFSEFMELAGMLHASLITGNLDAELVKLLEEEN